MILQERQARGTGRGRCVDDLLDRNRQTSKRAGIDAGAPLRIHTLGLAASLFRRHGRYRADARVVSLNPRKNRFQKAASACFPGDQTVQDCIY
jgi:hypothetical protein